MKVTKIKVDDKPISKSHYRGSYRVTIYGEHPYSYYVIGYGNHGDFSGLEIDIAPDVVTTVEKLAAQHKLVKISDTEYVYEGRT